MSDNISVEIALEALKERPAWGLDRTHGSMFFLEIGLPLLRAGSKKVHGEWHFLVEMSQWRIETKDKLIVGSDDDQPLIDREFAALDLGQVKEATAPAPSYDLRLVFSSGIRLVTFATSTAVKDRWPQWMLFCPDDNVWVLNSGGSPLRKSIHES